MIEITALHEAEDLTLEDNTIVKQGVFDRKVSLTEATAQGWSKIYGYSYKGQHSTSKLFVTYKDFTLYLGQAYFVDSGVILPYMSSNSDPTLDPNMKSIYDLRGSISSTTASNIGTGEGIFSSKVGEDLQFKSLKAVGASISSDSDSVTVTVSSGTGDMSKTTYDPTNIQADTFARGNHTGVQAISTISNLQSSLDSKVDEVAGKQLSDENYTLGEKTKLSGLDDTTYWKGDYLTVAALELAHPTSNAGSYAFVDAGVGVDAVKYIWDSSDSKWVSTGGSGGTETPATIKTKYESNADTNAFTDNDVLEVAKITDKVDKVAGKALSENDYDDVAVLEVSKVVTKKDKTTKTINSTGDLPAWASWIADSSAGALSRPMNPSPVDGEESECIDSTSSASTNNITHTAVSPTTVVSPTLDTDGQSKKWRYDAVGDVWDLVFSQAPASSGGGNPTVYVGTITIAAGDVSQGVSIPAVPSTDLVEMNLLGYEYPALTVVNVSIQLTSSSQIMAMTSAVYSDDVVVHYQYSVYPSGLSVYRGRVGIPSGGKQVSIPAIVDLSKARLRLLGNDGFYKEAVSISFSSPTQISITKGASSQSCNVSYEYTVYD